MERVFQTPDSQDVREAHRECRKRTLPSRPMDISRRFDKTVTMKDEVKTTGAVALVSSGIAAAFGLAACCAIPLLLAGIGIGAAGWLAPIVSASQPYATLLTIFSLVALVGSVAIVWRAPRHCQPSSICARPAFRWAISCAAAIGAILLVLSKIYD